MSTRKYNSNIYGQQDVQAWRHGGLGNVDSASIDSDKILSITLADGQPVIATGRAGHFSATPDVAGRIFYSNGNVGIGPVQNPPTSLYVSSNNTASVSVATYSDIHSPKITIDNARGNSDSPQDAAVDDISSLVFRNYQGVVWVNSGVIRSQLKNIDGKSNLDFYVNGGSGEEKVFSLNNSGNVGIGTDSPSEMLHIASGGKAALFIEADNFRNDQPETNTAYIKMSQDFAAVTGYVGFTPGDNLSPENTTYDGALNNALLISNDWDSGSAAVQIGARSLPIATFKDGRVGIGVTSPLNELDINGDIRIRGNEIKDSSGATAIVMDGSANVSISNELSVGSMTVGGDLAVDGDMTVDGVLSFKELAFGTVYSYDGIRKYPIRELNDSLWRADIRAGDSLNYAGTTRPIYYPENLHGENINAGSAVTSLLSSSDVAAGVGGPNVNQDLFEFESSTSWRNAPTTSGNPKTFNGTVGQTHLPERLFNGRWSDGERLANGESHRFVINLMKHKGFSTKGLSYSEGTFYIGFFNTINNFAQIKLEGFFLQSSAGTIHPDTGRWVQLGDPITSREDPRNINTLAPNRCTFEMTMPPASSVRRPVINQRTGEVLDSDGAKSADYYMSALRVTIDVPDLPFDFPGQTEEEYYLANSFRGHVPSGVGCMVSDVAAFFIRRQVGAETSFFNKYDAMTALPGGIWFQDGSKDEPTIAFYNGEDYGIFYDSTNSQMGLSGGGNEAITIDASGDVTKLGQDVPVQSEVLTWDGAKAVWSPNAASAGITEVLEDLTPQLGGDLDVNGNSITSSGDLDISINSSGPGAVHVAGSEPTISIQRGSNANPSSIDFMGAAGFVGAYVRHIENQDVSGGTNNDLAIGTGGTVEERLRITGDGRVGIGITNPDKQLHVTSDIKVDGTTTLNGIEYAWPAADGQSGQTLITDGNGIFSWVDADSVAGIESQQIMIDFNINTKPMSTNVGRVYARNAGVGNIDGGTISQEIIVSDQGGPSASNSGFDRNTDTTFETTIDEARNHFMCGFIAHDSNLVRVQTVTMPVHSWVDGLYASIWRGTYTNLSDGNVVWNRVSLINAVNDEDNSLTAGTISFDEDVINSNNSFSKGDLWALIFWSDAVAVGASTSNTWVTGNLFFDKN